MRAVPSLVAGLTVLVLGGCHRAADSVAHLAEGARSATERLAAETEASNAQRERQIDPYVADLRGPPPLRFSERYETREGPDGLFVYDTQTHSIARIGQQAQDGLTFEQARAAMDALTTADANHPGQ